MHGLQRHHHGNVDTGQKKRRLHGQDDDFAGGGTYVEAVAKAVIHDWNMPHQKRKGFLRTMTK